MEGTKAPGTVRRPGRVRRRLRVGRLDVVTAADLLIAFIVFSADNAWLFAENHRHGDRRTTDLLILLAFITAVPLVLRDRRPLAAWISSTVAITISATMVVPHQDISAPSIP